jgi:hypothetical protein
VHFSGSVNSSQVSPSNANIELELTDSDHPAKYKESKRELNISPLPLRSMDHRSKETLNQSSSKGLPNLPTFNQGQDGSKVDLKLNKYSSIHS